jgi:hypothetical protein
MFLPSKVPCTGIRTIQLDMIMWNQSNKPQKRCTKARRQGRPHHSGPAEPPGAAALAQLIQTSHRASDIQRNTASSNPDRRSEVGSVQRTRLDSLGSMDPQTSDQPTLGNSQHFIYTKEHALECMTRGPKAGRTKGSGRTSFPQQTDPQPPSNRLKDQNTDTWSKGGGDHRVGRTWRYGRTSLPATASPSHLQIPPLAVINLLGHKLR